MESSALIRTQERQAIHESITQHTGNIIQVFGPPQVGKSTLINQVVHDLLNGDRTSSEDMVVYSIMCKHIYSLQELYNEVVKSLWTKWDFVCDLTFTLKLIKKAVQKFPNSKHVFVFHKCESFSEHGKSRLFLCFLGEILNLFRSDGYKVNILLSTYKRFPACGDRVSLINVRLLTRKEDIFTLLSHYARGVNVYPYIKICQRYLCLPGPIRHLATKYISSQLYTYSLVDLICSKYECLSEGLHQDDNFNITSWLLAGEIDLITTMSITGSNPYNKATVEKMMETNHLDTGHSSYKGLVDSLVIDENGEYLTVHPLALLLCSTYTRTYTRNLQGPTNSYTHLIGNIVTTAELNRLKHGKKGYTCGCHHLEWPDIKELCHTAIQTGEFKHILRVAVVAKRLIMVTYPNEAKQFFKGLYESAQIYGSSREEAVMEALLGHTIASGAGNVVSWTSGAGNVVSWTSGAGNVVSWTSGAGNVVSWTSGAGNVVSWTSGAGNVVRWIYLAGNVVRRTSGAGINFKEAIRHLDSALDTLEESGPTFFYKWALRRKAIILWRMGDYPKSIEYFQRANTAQVTTPLPPSDHQTLSVTAIQEEEDNIIGDIHETIPMMNLGDDKTALKKSKDLYETINDRYDNHPDYEVLLNNIGLATHRLTGDSKDALVWFEKSLNHRYLLAKINPLNLIVTLVNVATLKSSAGHVFEAERDLLKGLEILREGYWYHHNCAILLSSLADVNVKLRKFQEVCVYLTQAEEILEKVNKDHQLRLHVNMKLIHFRLLLKSQGEPVRQSKESRQQLESQLEVVMDLGSRIRRQIGEDGHHNLMSAYEHGLVFNWRGSRSNSYKKMLQRYVEENVAIKEAIDKSVSSVLGNHRHFVEYVKNTREENWKFEEIMKNLNKCCSVCCTINQILDLEMWLYERLVPLQPEVTIISSEMSGIGQHITHRVVISPHNLLRRNDSNYALLYYPNFLGKSFSPQISNILPPLDNVWSCQGLVKNPSVLEESVTANLTLNENISLTHLTINSSISELMDNCNSCLYDASVYSKTPVLSGLVINSSISARNLRSIGLSRVNPSGFAESSYFIAVIVNPSITSTEEAMVSLTCVNVSNSFSSNFADRTSYITTSFDPNHLLREEILINMNCMNVSGSFVSGFVENTSLNQAIFGQNMAVSSGMNIEETCIDLSDVFLSELGDIIFLIPSILNPSLSITEELNMSPYCINVSSCVSMCIMESNTFPISPDKSEVDKTDSYESSKFEVLAETPLTSEADQRKTLSFEPSNWTSSFSVINSSISSKKGDLTGSDNFSEIPYTNASGFTDEQFNELRNSSSFSVINSSISSTSSTNEGVIGSENSSEFQNTSTSISDLIDKQSHEHKSSTSSSFCVLESFSMSLPSSTSDDHVGSESSPVTEK